MELELKEFINQKKNEIKLIEERNKLLRTLSQELTEAENALWKLQKQHNPDLIECKYCKAQHGTERCSFCEVPICDRCSHRYRYGGFIFCPNC